MNNIEKGKYGEELASNYLEIKGYRLIDRNYSNKIGEIDIICTKGDILIFAEVKSRTSSKYGYPREAVGKKKQEKIRRISSLYLLKRELKKVQCRYDVLEVNLRTDEVNHIINAF